MKFRSINAEYEIVPPVAFGEELNRELPGPEMFSLVVTGINAREQGELETAVLVDKQAGRPLEELRARQYEKIYALVKSKVVSIHNYSLPEGDIADFDQLVEHGSPKLVDYLFATLTSLEALSLAEKSRFIKPPDAEK